MPQIGLILVLTVVIVGLGGLIGLLGALNVVSSRSEVSERLETYAFIPEETARRLSDRRGTRFLRMRLRLNNILSVLSSEELGLKLVSANWPITESEYLLIRISSTALGGLLGWVFLRSIFPSIGLGLLAFIIPELILQTAIHNRRLKFERQLVDVLVLIKGAVRAGYSFLQALDVVVEEMPAPASEEFRRVRREVALGLPLGQALENLFNRMQNNDLYLMVTAIKIHSQVGGNLSTMVEAVTNTIRERMRLLSEIRALTSQQRYSAYMLTFLPFIVAGAMFILNPTYIKRLFEPGPILCVPIGAVIMVLIGNIVIRVISKIEV